METALEMRIERPVYEQEEIYKLCEYVQPKLQLWNTVYHKYHSWNAHNFILKTIPVISWMRYYKWKNDIFDDIVAGFTVAIMHIPQGLAYALLGNVPPIVGIYMAFFPVLVYCIFGTSRHVSMGTFAVVCLMTGQSVVKYSSEYMEEGENIISENRSVSHFQENQHTAMEVAMAVTLMVGIYEILMYIFHLGIVCTFLSDTLVSGFITGAAIHVLTSQVKDLLGLRIARYNGPFKIIYTYIDVFSSIMSSNLASVVVSAITMAMLIISNEFIKPLISKVTTIPVPNELIAVVSGTLISTYADLENSYNLSIVGYIPTGLPYPKIPSLDLMSDVAADSFIITIISYTVTMSMALLFAGKLNYKVDYNQELLAQGAGNIAGSFFSCMPFTASLSRSLIQQTSGGKTQLASIFSCCVLLCVLLWVGPFFEKLPRCILASIIVIALKGMLWQVKDLPKFWKLSTIDGVVWISTFTASVLLDIDIGLLVGIVVSVLSVFLYSIKPHSSELGVVPKTDIYLDISQFKGLHDVRGVKIIRYQGILNYVTKDYFKKKIQNFTGNRVDNIPKQNKNSYQQEPIKCIILDFSSLSYIDPSGVNTLKLLHEEFIIQNTCVLFVGCSSSVYKKIRKCNLTSDDNKDLKFFPTIHDAVLYTRNRNTENFCISYL